MKPPYGKTAGELDNQFDMLVDVKEGQITFLLLADEPPPKSRAGCLLLFHLNVDL